MRLERSLVLALLEVPKADTRIFTRRRHQVVERMYRNLGYFSTMPLHGVFGGLSRQSIPYAWLLAEGGQLRHALKLLVLHVLLHLLGLGLQLHDLLFKFYDAGPLLLE